MAEAPSLALTSEVTPRAAEKERQPHSELEQRTQSSKQLLPSIFKLLLVKLPFWVGSQCQLALLGIQSEDAARLLCLRRDPFL